MLPDCYRIGYGVGMTEDTAPPGAPDPLVPFNVKIPFSLKRAVTERAARDHTSQRAAAIALLRAGVAADHEARRVVYCAPGEHYAPASDVTLHSAPGESLVSMVGVCAPCLHLLGELGMTPAEYMATTRRED